METAIVIVVFVIVVGGYYFIRWRKRKNAKGGASGVQYPMRDTGGRPIKDIDKELKDELGKDGYEPDDIQK